ncbi:MAG: NYN domain-containing protein [Coriobacteriales bacterium]|nr:NYN domain-containing protein [Coriobacteriales bacterium]
MARRALLVVDGYNVIYGTVRYQGLIDEHAGAGALADVAHLSRDPYGHDPFGRAREALLADVAAYAQGTYDPVIVFDGAGNLSEDRPDFSSAGVRIVFSRTGESADTVIERLVTRARHENRDVLLVTSDNTIRFTVGGIPVTSISSQLLATDLGHVDHDVETAREERSHGRMTLEDRLSPEAREKLRKLMGR